MFLHVGCNFVSNRASWNFLVKFCTQHSLWLYVHSYTILQDVRPSEHAHTTNTGQHTSTYMYTTMQRKICAQFSVHSYICIRMHLHTCIHTKGSHICIYYVLSQYCRRMLACKGSKELGTGSDAGDSPSLLN
jgi:hypothetical protein